MTISRKGEKRRPLSLLCLSAHILLASAPGGPVTMSLLVGTEVTESSWNDPQASRLLLGGPMEPLMVRSLSTSCCRYYLRIRRQRWWTRRTSSQHAAGGRLLLPRDTAAAACRW